MPVMLAIHCCDYLRPDWIFSSREQLLRRQSQVGGVVHQADRFIQLGQCLLFIVWSHDTIQYHDWSVVATRLPAIHFFNCLQSFGWQKAVWVAENNLITWATADNHIVLPPAMLCDMFWRHMQGLNSYYYGTAIIFLLLSASVKLSFKTIKPLSPRVGLIDWPAHRLKLEWPMNSIHAFRSCFQTSHH